MLLSQQTLEGLRIIGTDVRMYMCVIVTFNWMSVVNYRNIPTVNSFTEMAHLLFALPGVNYLLSEKLYQDPVESFFGKQRAHGGRSDDPTVKQFCDNIVSLRVQGLAALEPICGNCRKRKVDSSEVVNSKPLCKRKQNSRKKN